MNHKKHQDVHIMSDACVLIDIEQSELTAAMFSLPFQFAVPDTLYEKELSEKHSKLLQFGLIKKSMSGKRLAEVQKLYQQCREISENDWSVCLHSKYQKCLLLTGDRQLREKAEGLGIKVHGTIWLVEQMIDHKKISIEDTRLGFQCMKDSGNRRLPWDEVQKMLQRKEKESKDNY